MVKLLRRQIPAVGRSVFLSSVKSRSRASVSERVDLELNLGVRCHFSRKMTKCAMSERSERISALSHFSRKTVRAWILGGFSAGYIPPVDFKKFRAFEEIETLIYPATEIPLYKPFGFQDRVRNRDANPPRITSRDSRNESPNRNKNISYSQYHSQNISSSIHTAKSDILSDFDPLKPWLSS